MKLIRRHNSRPGHFPTFFDDFIRRDQHELQRFTKPLANIVERDNDFGIELAAPGYNKEDFNIEAQDNVLTISVNVDETEASKTNELHYTRKEFATKGFVRRFTLPEDKVQAEGIVAQYTNGLLTISLPKREEAKPKPARVIDIA